MLSPATASFKLRKVYELEGRTNESESHYYINSLFQDHQPHQDQTRTDNEDDSKHTMKQFLDPLASLRF